MRFDKGDIIVCISDFEGEGSPKKGVEYVAELYDDDYPNCVDLEGVAYYEDGQLCNWTVDKFVTKRVYELIGVPNMGFNFI